jgi:hypothetical protein
MALTLHGTVSNNTDLKITGPAFSVYQSSQQTGISNQTWTKVTLTTENFDTDSKFASSRFTPTVAGYYQLSGGIQVASTTATQYTKMVLMHFNLLYQREQVHFIQLQQAVQFFI